MTEKNERGRVIRWIKEHKRELIIAGFTGIGTIVLLILGIRNKETIQAVWSSLKSSISRTPECMIVGNTAGILNEVNSTDTPMPEICNTVDTECIPFEVKRHIRNLPSGWHASLQKQEEALKNGIVLSDGQTWVEGYEKYGFVA